MVSTPPPSCVLADALVREGFDVLSYDRVGVGFSDANPTGTSPTWSSVVADMHFVMERVAPGGRWILLGPSMGSVVAQCYIAVHPAHVVGLLNMDGFPCAFAAKAAKFRSSGKMYAFLNAMAWSGLVRPMVGYMRWSGLFKRFQSPAFPEAVIAAQMNDGKFWANTGLEMMTMVGLAAAAGEAWGNAALLSLTKEQVRHGGLPMWRQ